MTSELADLVLSPMITPYLYDDKFDQVKAKKELNSLDYFILLEFILSYIDNRLSKYIGSVDSSEFLLEKHDKVLKIINDVYALFGNTIGDICKARLTYALIHDIDEYLTSMSNSDIITVSILIDKKNRLISVRDANKVSLLNKHQKDPDELDNVLQLAWY